MSDDLVTWPRGLVECQVGDVPVRIHQAADRIEELEAGNKGLVRLNEATQARAEAAEAKLAKAVEALGEIATDESPLGWIAIATLAELKGEKNE